MKNLEANEGRMPESMENSDEEIQELIRVKIENLRRKLLDLTRRNPLISTKFSPRSNSHIRIVDELPDALLFNLGDQKKMRFVSLPPLDEDPTDEQTRQFRDALSNARLIDEIYLAAVDGIDPYREIALEQNRQLERELKDRIRDQLGMAPHRRSGDVPLPQHAKNNGISPSYELPEPDYKHEDGRHLDADIQTLLLSDDLERKMNALMTKCRTWVQETGINVLHVAYGFLEWTEPKGKTSSFAPLVLSAVEIEKKKTRGGPEFWVKGNGDKAETNMVLAEMLRLNFEVKIPIYEGGSIEDYFNEVAEITPASLDWKVRRQVAFGVFPSARMAMYHDLDTSQNSFDEHEVIGTLFGGSATGGTAPFADEYEVDHPDVEKKVPCLVLDADSSQFSTLVDVADGKNLAVEGPPGTGKSQTIVNAIAAGLADGKKILFVAEKMAALDVVKSRLEAIGLGEFILPLQATRSSREQVIQSIRERVEMTVGRVSNDYDAKIERYKKTRSELAAYIDAISAQFGNTGLKVFDILGKSIATNNVLLGKPKALQGPEIYDIEEFDSTRIDTLRELGTAVETAWRATEKAESYWRGHQILNIDRFSAENVCDLAENAADAYQKAAEARNEIVLLGIDPEANGAELKPIGESLRVLENIGTAIDTALVGRVCRERKLQALTSFLDRCRRFQEGQEVFSHIFVDTTDGQLGERLRSIRSLCSDHGFDTLDLKKLHGERQEEASSLTESKKALENLKPFVATFPESAGFTISMLKKAQELVAFTPRAILALRNEITADPAAAGVVTRAKTQAEELLERREHLKNVISVTQEISNAELTVLAAAINGAGLLRVFSPSFRLAKRTYLSLSRRDAFKKDAATEDIRSLIDWKEAERKYCSDQQVSTVFGLHFKGIETDFEKFDHLMNYYDAVENNCPGAINRDIRKFLKSGDLDLLQSIPEIDDGIEHGTFTEFSAEIGRIEAKQSRLDVALETLGTLTSGLKNPAKISIDSLLDLADGFDTHLKHKAMIDCDGEAKNLLYDRFGEASTEPKCFDNDVLAAESILSLEGNVEIVLEILEGNTVEKSRSAIEHILGTDSAAENELRTLCERTKIDTAQFLANRKIAEVSDHLWSASQDKNGLYVYSEYAVARHDLNEKGFDWVTTALLKEKFSLDSLGVIIEAVIIRALVIRVYHQFGSVLSKYPGAKLDERRALFAKLDKEIIELSRGHLKQKVNGTANPPSGVGIGRKSTWTEMSLIDNEVGKKKRFISARDLTKRAGKALLELKPCWMMSPLAVAQYLPKGELAFDLCIIDEASQMPPEEAVGALARCRQAMVVGDTNQLPPTSFFKKLFDDEDADEDETILNDSILEMANSAFRPRRRLRWHYRSRHPSLIKFSSHMVYNDDLVVFPSAHDTRPDMGVSLKLVQGSYHSGTNSEEAKAMIDAALNFMRTNPDRSLGMVTLNQKQRDLLIEEMEYAVNRDNAASNYIDRWKEKNDGLETFFIKNLENVQGDERDVIFIGTVYGPAQPGGPVMQRFGPINGLAGQRRLNVLFSRAKQQIITFSSMTAADIRADEDGNLGTYMLKRWLEYSATGILHAGEQTNLEPDSDFEVFVMDQIRAMGCEPVPQIGVVGYRIDIGVKHPEWPHGFIMAVECDGATYHSSKSARDRDRLRQEVLEGLGWFFHRIWSTDWFNDPHKEAEILRAAITARLQDLKDNSDLFTAPVITPVATEDELTPLFETVDEISIQDETEFDTPDFDVEIPDPNYISAGDTVRVRYLSGTETIIQVTLSETNDALEQGIMHIDKPLGRALLGMEEGDEIEVLTGSILREAIIEKVIKADTNKKDDTPSTPKSSEEAKKKYDQRPKSNENHNSQTEAKFFDPLERPTNATTKILLSADRFYEPEYLRVIRNLGIEHIDAEGPITFRHLSTKLARAHGFQRTGAAIKKQIWAAVSQVRKSTQAPNDETIFWPDGSEPEIIIPFRGLTGGDDGRSWHDVPYPEKLGLAHSFLNRNRHSDVVGAMASKIGLGRLTQKTREELEALLKKAREMDGSAH
jgi:transcription elongation GreA/GreB family factor